MTGTAKWIFLGLGVVAISVGAVFFVHRDGTPGETPNQRAGSSKEVNPLVAVENDADAREASKANAAPVLAGAGAVRGKLEYGYAWNPARPGEAASEEDAAWLNSRGYPGPEVYEYLNSIPKAELRRLADSGNVTAMAIYAYSLARRPGNHSEILNLLHQAASTGSVYSLNMGSHIFSGTSSYRDPTMSLAYSQLQARAGDQSGFTYGYITQLQMTPEQIFVSNIMAEQMWKGFAGTRLVAESANARPGYEEFVASAVSAGNTGGR